MKEWKELKMTDSSLPYGWGLYLNNKQAAVIYRETHDLNFDYKFNASFDNTSYGYHGLNSKTLEDAKEEVEKILFEGYSEAVNRHTRIADEYDELLQCLSFKPNKVIEIKKRMRLAHFGDNCFIRFPDEPVDCTRLGYFDDLEYDCMDLVKKYAEHFGFKILDIDDDDEKNPISFDIAKDIQECVLGWFEGVGIKFDHCVEG